MDGTQTVAPKRASLDDLMRTEGKAELIGGRIVRFMASGDGPNTVAAEIFVSLRAHSRNTGVGKAYTDGMGFTVTGMSSGRESFSPDAAFHLGPRPLNPMRFIEGPPTFAVEVRSENDYGSAAERAMAEKRADYFEAGTLVVWDVDPLARTVRSYRRDDPDQPTTFGPGETADAEPAVPGWRVDLAEIFA